MAAAAAAAAAGGGGGGGGAVQWSQLFDGASFRWSVPTTPFSAPLIPWAVCIGYLVVIFALQRVMASRKAFNVTALVVVHNAVLLVWAVSMFVGCVVYGWQRITQRGWFTAIFCETDEAHYGGSLIWVTYWFYLSKYWELLDTIIIILKKRDLIFLHWYHHFAAVLLSWNNLESVWPQFWVCVMFNSLIHTFMYFYYMASALKYNVWWKRFMTEMQLVQFFIFITMCLINLYMMAAMPSLGCLGSLWAPVLNTFWIISLIVLFTQFYRRTYRERKRKQAAAAATGGGGSARKKAAKAD